LRGGAPRFCLQMNGQLGFVELCTVNVSSPSLKYITLVFREETPEEGGHQGRTRVRAHAACAARLAATCELLHAAAAHCTHTKIVKSRANFVQNCVKFTTVLHASCILRTCNFARRLHMQLACIYKPP